MLIVLEQVFWISLLSMSPFSELRGGIPLGLLVFHLNPIFVYIVCVLANFLFVPFWLIFLKKFSQFLMRRFSLANKLLGYSFSRTEKRHSQKFAKWKDWALLILVAIPLPFTGAWTGGVAAFLFDVPTKRALAMIFLGVAIAGIIVSVLTMLGIGAFNGVK